MVVQITLRMDSSHTPKLSDGRSANDLNPKELLLYSALYCASLTLKSILKEHLSQLNSMEMTLEGRLSTPQIVAESQYTQFNIIYRAECRTLESQAVIGRAINLLHDKHCGLLQMLRRIAPLTNQISIVTTGKSTAE